jgi:AcrR family transcriptional regulator
VRADYSTASGGRLILKNHTYAFDNVSISEIMKGADLTHGGFYSYFKGKSALYTEVLGASSPTPIGRTVGEYMWTSRCG